VHTGDEEQFCDLLTIMELLSSMMTKDFIDLPSSGSETIYCNDYSVFVETRLAIGKGVMKFTESEVN
jgi:hypothetical protein